MDYTKAQQYWDIKDKEKKVMPKEELKGWIDSFILSNNTLALATASEDYIDCTPVEYRYVDDQIYIYTEGGHKFIGLEKRKEVSATIYENYTGFQSIHSVQIYGSCEIVEMYSEEYFRLMEIRKIPRESASKLSLYLLRINISKINVLCSDFRKEGYSSRQTIDF